MKPVILGFYDSGVGGNNVATTLLKKYDFESIHFIDTKLFPLGEKSAQKIIAGVHAGILNLKSRGAEQVIIACHTASVHIPDSNEYKKITDVFRKFQAREGDWVICTQACYNSEWYQNLGYNVLAMPLLATLIETAQIHKAEEYCREKLRNIHAKRLFLCCTHYPVLGTTFYESVLPGARIIDPAEYLELKLAVL